MSIERPRVLIVYYTFSKQTERVAETMGARLEQRGIDVTRSRIELTDQRWAKRFETVPMRFPMLKIFGMLPAQTRGVTGEVRIPPEARQGGYDLVVVGSPTWWFRLSLPMRSYLRSPDAKPVFAGDTPFAAYTTSRRYWKRNVKDIREMGEANGGTYVGQTHFVAAGNQVTSMLSWLSYMSGISMFDRLLRLPPANLQAGFETQAEEFIDGIADHVFGVPGAPATAPTPAADGAGPGADVASPTTD